MILMWSRLKNRLLHLQGELGEPGIDGVRVRKTQGGKLQGWRLMLWCDSGWQWQKRSGRDQRGQRRRGAAWSEGRSGTDPLYKIHITLCWTLFSFIHLFCVWFSFPGGQRTARVTRRPRREGSQGAVVCFCWEIDLCYSTNKYIYLLFYRVSGVYLVGLGVQAQLEKRLDLNY